MDGTYRYECLTVSGWRGCYGHPITDGEYKDGFAMTAGPRGDIQLTGILDSNRERLILAADMWRETGRGYRGGSHAKQERRPGSVRQ